MAEMGLGEIVCEVVDWVELVYSRVWCTFMFHEIRKCLGWV